MSSAIIKHYRPSTRRVIVLLSLCIVACQREPQVPVRLVPQVAPVEPRRLDIAASGQRLLVQEPSGLVGIWDLPPSGAPQLRASMAAGAVDARFTSDGTAVITGGWDGRVRRWGDDGRLLWVSSERHGDRVRCLAVAADLIVSGGEDGAIRFWRLDGTAVGEPLAAHEIAVMSVAITPSGDLVSMGGDESIRLWRRAQGQPPTFTFTMSVLYQDPNRQFRAALPNMLRLDPLWGWDRAVAVSPRGDVFAGAVLDGTVRLFNADGSGRGIPNPGHGKRHVRALAFAPRGDLVATAGWDGRVQLWNVDGTPHGEGFRANEGLVFTLAFSPQGDYLATSGKDDRVRLWNLDGTARGELPAGHPEKVLTVALAPQEPTLAVAYRIGREGAVRVWNLDGTPRARHGREHDFPLRSLAFSPRGDLFVTGDRGGNVQVWKTDGTAYAKPFHQHRGDVTAVAISPNGDLIASGSRHEPLLMWDLKGQSRTFMTGVGDSMSTIAFSPKGNLVAAGGVPGFVQVWDTNGGIRIAPFKAHIEFFHAVTFAPSGDYFATTGGGSSAVKLWNLDGTPRGAPLEGHVGSVKALAFAPTTELLASGADDGVRLWNTAKGTVERLEIGLPVNQVGFWRDLLWVRVNGETLLFFNAAHQQVATVHLRRDSLLLFTPDGWFASTGNVSRAVLAFGEKDELLPSEETAQYMKPGKVIAALTGARP